MPVFIYKTFQILKYIFEIETQHSYVERSVSITDQLSTIIVTLYIIWLNLFPEWAYRLAPAREASYNARLGKIDTVKVIIDGPNDYPVIEMAAKQMNVEESSGKQQS